MRAVGSICWTLAALMSGAFAAAAAVERTDCGHRNVEVVSADRADLAAACSALADTAAYFRRIGFRLQPRFDLRYEDHETHRTADPASAYGHFDSRSRRIVVHASSTIEPWGLAWDRKLAASFVRHELVHMALWEIFDGDRARLAREWHEFIAYAVQFELMDPGLRRKVLARGAGVQPFQTLEAVNEFTYGMNPDVFAVAAYRSYRERGADKFVGRLLRGEIVPPRLASPHPEHSSR